MISATNKHRQNSAHPQPHPHLRLHLHPHLHPHLRPHPQPPPHLHPHIYIYTSTSTSTQLSHTAMSAAQDKRKTLNAIVYVPHLPPSIHHPLPVLQHKRKKLTCPHSELKRALAQTSDGTPTSSSSCSHHIPPSNTPLPSSSTHQAPNPTTQSRTRPTAAASSSERPASCTRAPSTTQRARVPTRRSVQSQPKIPTYLTTFPPCVLNVCAACRRSTTLANAAR